MSGCPLFLAIILLSKQLQQKSHEDTRLPGLAGPAVVGVVITLDGPVADLVTVDERVRRQPKRRTVEGAGG